MMCHISTETSPTELRAIELFSKHLNSLSKSAKILCNPESVQKCPSNTDFMLDIEKELWFVEHTMLGFDSLVENRIKLAEEHLDEPLRLMALKRNIRLVVTLKFKQREITVSELDNILLAISHHLDLYDQGKKRAVMFYPLLNDVLDIQIMDSEFQGAIDRFGPLTLGFTLGLSSQLGEQFELANRAHIEKKFKTQIRRVENVQKTALIIDQTYKLKEDGSVFHGNGTFPTELIKRKLDEIASTTEHQINQVWLINMQDEVLLLNEWS